MISVTGMCVGKHVDIHSMQSTNENIFITTVPSYSLAKLNKITGKLQIFSEYPSIIYQILH